MSRRMVFDVDENGIDPLAGEKLDKILAISDYREIEVDSSTEANPQLIAHREYGSVEFYWIVLYYNGIGYSFDLTAGMLIRLPSSLAVKQALADSQPAIRQNTANRTIEI